MHKRMALLARVVLFVALFSAAVISGHIATPCHAQIISEISTFAQSEHKILFLRSYGYGRQGPEIYNSKFFSVLLDAGMDPEDVMLEYLDLNRNRDMEYRTKKRDLILYQYLGKQIDLIVAVEQPALIFLLEELKDLAPGVPVMAINATVPTDRPTSGHRFLQKTVNLDFKGTLERALELFPKTRRVVVVTGAAEQDLAVKTESQATADLWKEKLEFEYTDHMSMAEILRRIANLPPQTIVIYRAINSDRTGQIFVPYNALLEITKVANAPVFGLYDNYVGSTGIVGGSVYHITQEAEYTARIALAIMEGGLQLNEPLKTLPSEGVPMFDWQQINRWGGDESRLPADSIVVKRPSTLWEQYKAIVISIAIVFLVMATLIASLFIQNRRRKVAETLVRESEERYRSVLENQTELVCRFIPDGTFTFVNDAYYNFFDIPKGELVGKKWHPLPANTDVEFIKEKLVQLCPSHPTVIIDNKVLSGKREIRWVQFVNTGFFDNHGNLQEIQSVGRDITELKQMLQSLRESESLLSSIFRAAPTGIGVVSNLILQAVNDRLCDMIGYSREEMLGQSARMLYPSDAHFENVGSEKYRQIHQYGTGTVETLWQCKNGRIIDVLMSSTPINLLDLSEGVTFTALDITERKKSENALRESEERFRKLFQKHSAVQLIIDPDTGNIIDANDAASSFYGWTIEKIRRMRIQQINVLPHEAVKSEIDEAESLKSPSFEFHHRKADGSIRDVEVFSN
ncbi:MAG: PAS domain S-box protein [Pseudomonadota bacterium]